MFGLSLAQVANAAGAVFYMHDVEIVKEGEGEIPDGHYLMLHAKGMLMDGTVFEDSREDGDKELKKYFFGQNEFPCWEEALP